MSLFRRFELLQPPSSTLFYGETCICKPRSPLLFPFSSFTDDEAEEQLAFTLDILNPGPLNHLPPQCLLPFPAPSPLDFFAGAANFLQAERMIISSYSKPGKFQERAETELQLRSLSDRVTALEMGFDRFLNPNAEGRDRKYTWTAEIKGPKEEDGVDLKYKWIAEAKNGGEKNYQWKAEIKGKGKNAPRTYTFQASTAPATGLTKTKEAEKGGKKDNKGSTARAVEISESDQGALVLKRALAKKAVNQSKGRRNEISPHDAALIIQISYRAHLVRRSRVLRGLRDLAVAKAKLKELRSLFSNFSYRHRIFCDAEERQRFSEKIIVLLLTVDAIEGSDFMVRAARRSMVNELEAMLDAVDPQGPGKLGSMKRRKFDLPEIGATPKEMAMGVAEVVRMLNQVDNSSNA